MDTINRLKSIAEFLVSDMSRLRVLEEFCASSFGYVIPTPPLPPSGLRAWRKGANDVGLDWTNLDGATSYTVDWSSDLGKTWAKLDTLVGNGRYIRHYGCPSGRQMYRIKSSNAFGDSAYSPAITFDLDYMPTVSAPSDVRNCETEMAMFFNCADVCEVNQSVPGIVRWNVVDPNGLTLIDHEGFNIAFLPEVPGDYKVTVENRKTGKSKNWIGRVVQKKWDVVSDPVDLAKAIKESTVNTKIVLTRPSTMAASYPVKGRIVANGNVVEYTGPTYTTSSDGSKQWPIEVFPLAKGASIDGINFTGSCWFTNIADRGMVPKFAGSSGDNYISNCKVSKVSFGVNLESNPNRVAYVGNVHDRYIGNYMVWMGGSDIYIAKNKAEDSSTEHIVRGAGYKYVTIVDNDFRNMDLRTVPVKDGGESWNFSKSCINCQWGEWVYVSGNIVRQSQLSVGPLGGGDGQKDGGQWTKYVVVRGNKCVEGSEFQIQHGIQYLLWQGNTGGNLMIRPYDPEYPSSHTVLDAEIQVAEKDGWFCWPPYAQEPKYLSSSGKGYDYLILRWSFIEMHSAICEVPLFICKSGRTALQKERKK